MQVQAEPGFNYNFMQNSEISFSDFGLEESLIESIIGIGYNNPTPIQAAAIPVILAGKDLLATAQTGTGKTAAFVIPVVNHLLKSKEKPGIKALIISPTRELALQIDQAIDGLSYHTGVSSVAIFGGSDKQEFDRQMNAIQRGVDILVATPGRLLQHLNLSYSDVSSVEILVLDEADKMLDMGFFSDIIKIKNEILGERQTLMFSATMPQKIIDFARQILKPEFERVSFKLSQPAEGAKQAVYILHEDQKLKLLLHIIKHDEIESLIVFTSSKLKADEFHALMLKNNINAHVFHSDIDQDQRIDLMRKFKNKEFPILVATDILSRGIDIDNLSHVVNVDVPHDAEDYIHRIGRTARSGRTGVAITFVNERDQRKFASIEKLIGKTIPKTPLPEGLGSAPEYLPYQDKRRPPKRQGTNSNSRNIASPNRELRENTGKGNSKNRNHHPVPPYEHNHPEKQFAPKSIDNPKNRRKPLPQKPNRVHKENTSPTPPPKLIKKKDKPIE